jgi:hypothetical protein
MIRDLSLSLRDMLVHGAQGAPELAAAQIAFDRPGDAFNPSQATISLYLYDIRENLELRSNEPDIRIDGGQAVIQRPPLRVACTYLVTAWPGNVSGDELALREHRLLAQVLQVFARNPTVPAASLQGLLADQAPPLPVITAQAEGLRNPSEFWTALSNRLRPSISVTVTLSMAAAAPVTAPVVVGSEFLLRSGTAVEADVFRIGGRVIDAASAAVPGAAVGIAALDLATRTGPDGRYVLGPLGAGDYALHVQQGAKAVDVTIHVPARTANGYDVTIPG